MLKGLTVSLSVEAVGGGAALGFTICWVHLVPDALPKGRCDYGFMFISGELWEMWTDDTVLHWHLTARRFWLWIPWGPEAFMRRTGESVTHLCSEVRMEWNEFCGIGGLSM